MADVFDAAELLGANVDDVAGRARSQRMKATSCGGESFDLGQDVSAALYALPVVDGPAVMIM